MRNGKAPGGADVKALKKAKTRKFVDTSNSKLIERLRESNKTLDSLVSLSFDSTRSLEELLERCTEALCHTLNVHRAGVWMFSDDHKFLIANDIYDYTQMNHTQGRRLELVEGPKFFNSLINNRRTVITDLNKDVKMAALWKDYFKTHNTHSILDIAIKSATGLYGVIGIESKKNDRDWTEDEFTFCASIAGLITLALESSYLRDAHNRIRQMSQYDELTGLGNRTHFLEKLRTSWDCVKSDMTSLHLYYISIDDFKQINDQYGHDIGDGILNLIGQRLTRVCKKYDTAIPFRLGGDEYACIVTGLDDNEANFFGRKLSRLVTHPYKAQSRKIVVNCSVSCAEAEKNMDTVNDLMSAADLALDTIKRDRNSKFALYTPELENTALKRKLMEADLMLAVQNIKTEMEVVIQPVVDSQSHKMISGELLLRWHNRRLGEQVRPDIFIDMAEDHGLIQLIDTHMFTYAHNLIKKWHEEFDNCPTLNINVSPVTLMGVDIVQNLDSIISKLNAPAGFVNIEITEGVEMHNELEMAKIFDEIRQRGPKVYIDDFGSGHTGLSYFTTIPVDAVKVDKSLIEKYLSCSKTKIIVNSILELSKSLDIDTVLEGVETQEEAQILSQFGDHVKLQGYYFGRPMAISEFERTYLTRKTRIKTA